MAVRRALGGAAGRAEPQRIAHRDIERAGKVCVLQIAVDGMGALKALEALLETEVGDRSVERVVGNCQCKEHQDHDYGRVNKLCSRPFPVIECGEGSKKNQDHGEHHDLDEDGRNVLDVHPV